MPQKALSNPGYLPVHDGSSTPLLCHSNTITTADVLSASPSGLHSASITVSCTSCFAASSAVPPPDMTSITLLAASRASITSHTPSLAMICSQWENRQEALWRVCRRREHAAGCSCCCCMQQEIHMHDRTARHCMQRCPSPILNWRVTRCAKLGNGQASRSAHRENASKQAES